MRKSISFLFVLFLLASLSVFSYADSKVYTISELDLMLEIPDYYDVFTEGFVANEEMIKEFTNLGVTTSEILTVLDSTGLYLNAIDDVSKNVLSITMSQSSQGDFAVFSDHFIERTLTPLEEGFGEYANIVTPAELYVCGQEKYIKLSYMYTLPLSNANCYVTQYYTVRGGKAINFVFTSYDDAMCFEEELHFEKIIKSITFQNEPMIPTGFDHVSSYGYKDEGSGASFTVPMNWKEAEYSADRQFLDAKFQSTERNDLIILYSSEDVYSELFQGQIGTLRSNMNDYYFTDENMAAIFGCDKDEVERISISDKKYYQAKVKLSKGEYGISEDLEVVYLAHLENGYLFYFLFNNSADDPYYDDFLSLVSSAVYPGFVKPKLSVPQIVGMKQKDYETGIAGVRPVDWSYDLACDVDNSVTKYNSRSDPSISILTWWDDAWASLPTEERVGHSRKDYSLTDLIESSFMSSIQGFENSKIVQLSSGEYLKTVVESEDSAKEIQLCRIKNGIVFNFLYVGDDKSPVYVDFINYLDSLDYSELNAAIYMTMPLGIKFGETTEEIHRILQSEPGKVTNDPNSAGMVTENYYHVDYASRPVEFDVAGNLKDYIDQCSVVIDYEPLYDSTVSYQVFYLMYLALDYLHCQDTINSYVYEMNKLYGECYEENVEDGALYYWVVGDREQVVDFQPVGDELYGISIWWTKHNGENHASFH